MKISYSYFKRTCLFLALFSWLLPMNLFADVTAEWGDWGSPQTNLPSNTSSTISGEINITLTSNIETQYLWLGGPNSWTQHNCYWMSGHLDISLSEGVISGVSASYWNNDDGSLVQIQFCSSTTYDSNYNLGSPITFTGVGRYESNLSSITSVPYGAKSARISSPNDGGYLYRLIVSASAGCASPATATFAKGDATSGSVDAIEACEGNNFTMPGKGSMAYAGHKFTGWKLNNTGDLITAGTSYEMPAGGASFTAQWAEVVVPTVTGLNFDNPLNSNIPLKWSIPGICDLSAYVGADVSIMDNFNGTNSSLSYDESSNTITAAGESGACGQYGIALPIPATKNIETITIDCKGNVDLSAKGVNLWGGIMADGGATYWDYEGSLHNYKPTSWEEETFTIDTRFWSGGSYSKSTSIKYVGVFANGSCGGTTTGISFSVRNVRYHIADQDDIHHVVLLRKEGSAATGIDDDAATILYNGTKSRFTDSESKTLGATYYYTVFAVDADGAVSAGVTISKTITDDTPRHVTYAAGDASVTGDLPTDATDYTSGSTVTIASPGNLEWTGHRFLGWSDGVNIYMPDDEYTMPNSDVVFTAQWRDIEVPILIPTEATRLDASNFYEAPQGTYSFDVDGTGASTCLDIAGNNYASWKVKFVPGRYAAKLAYGTPEASVNVTLKIYDGATEVMTVGSEHHEDGGGVHRYSPSWGLDLSEIDPDKIYTVKVIDTYGDNTSSPKLGYIDITVLTPIAIAGALTTLDASNVSINPGTVSFDIMNDGNEVLCLNIADQKQADWYVTIAPGTYNISMLYGTPEFATNVTLTIFDADDEAHPIYSQNQTHNGSGGEHFHETLEWTDVNFTAVDPAKKYFVRVKDTYGYNGSKPKVAYIKFENQTPSLTYYERAVTPGEYGTVCIGYAVEHANISGATMYEIDSWSADGKALTLSELGDSESMVAGRPYIFYATGNLLSLGYDGSASEASAGDHNGLIGSYSQEEITANADNYIIYQNKLWLVDVLAYVGANRAYIHKTTNASPAPGRRQIKLYVAGTEVATGLEQIVNGTSSNGKFIQNGQLFIRRDGRTYNAQGIEIK